jgi:hypothetical protein
MQTQLIGSTSPLQNTIPIIKAIRCMVQDRPHNELEVHHQSPNAKSLVKAPIIAGLAK